MTTQLCNFKTNHKQVNTVKIFPKSGQLIGTGGTDGTVKIWVIEKPELTNLPEPIVQLPHSSPVTQIAFDKLEEVCVSGCSSGEIKLWDLECQKESQNRMNLEYPVEHLEFHPLSEFYCSAGGNNVSVWDCRHRKPMQSYFHNVPVTCVKYSPDGRLVVSGDKNGSIKVWDMVSGALMKEISFTSRNNVVKTLSFHSHDLKLFCAYSNGIVKSFDLDTWAETLVDTNLSDPLYLMIDVDPVAGWILHGNRLARFDWNGVFEEVFLSDNSLLNTKDVCLIDENLVFAQINNDVVSVNSIDICSLNFVRKKDKIKKSVTFDVAIAELISVKDIKLSDKDEKTTRIKETKKVNFSFRSRKTREAVQEEIIESSNENFPPPNSINSINKTDDAEEKGILNECMKPHKSMCECLSSHLSDLKTIQQFWNQKADMVKILKFIQDKEAFSSLRDVIILFKRNASLWMTLDNCPIFIVVVSRLLEEYPQESHKEALELVSKFISNFSKLIVETIELQKTGKLLVSHEDRLSKCLSAAQAFEQLDETLGKFILRHPKEKSNLLRLRSTIHGITINTK